MKRLYVLIFLALLTISAGFAVIPQDFSETKIAATQVADHIYMLKGAGGNIGVSVGEDGVLMVDDQFAPLSERIKAAIRELGGDSPRYILNTHHHGDHTGGNSEFSKEGTIIAHSNVRKRLADKPKEGWPVITFDNALSVHMNGEEIKALHFPRGHTDGDAVIYFSGSNVVHMGDDFFSGLLPFVDLDNGGSVQGLIKNIERVLADLPADVTIIPGHGPVSTRADLETYQAMLLETSAIVRSAIAAGKSLDEIKKQGLPEKWSSWNWQFISTEKWLETLYNSFSAEMTQK